MFLVVVRPGSDLRSLSLYVLIVVVGPGSDLRSLSLYVLIVVVGPGSDLRSLSLNVLIVVIQFNIVYSVFRIQFFLGIYFKFGV